jgi:hypothetical protein
MAVRPWLHGAALFFVLLVAFLCIGVQCKDIPVPVVPDERAYLLSARLFLEGRVSQPTNGLGEHFESLYVLAEPALASRFPPMQSLFLALGMATGNAIMGVWIACAFWGTALFALCRELAGKTTAWLLTGLWLLFLAQDHYWVNSYWGGAVAAWAGTLTLLGAVRFRKYPEARACVPWAVGVIVLSLTRPFEGAMFALATVWPMVPPDDANRRARLRRLTGVMAATGLVALSVNLAYNAAVTGDALMFPYLAWENHYLKTPLFIWQEQSAAPGTGPFVTQVLRQGLLDSRSQGMALRDAFGRSLDSWRAAAGLGLAIFAPILAWRRRDSGKDALPILPLLLLPWLLHWISIPYFPHYAAPFAGLPWAIAALALGEISSAAFALPLTCGAIAAAALVNTTPVARYQPEISKARKDLTTILHEKAATFDVPVMFLVTVEQLRPSQAVYCGLYNVSDMAHGHEILAWDLGEAKNRRLLSAFPGRLPIRVTIGEPTPSDVRYEFYTPRQPSGTAPRTAQDPLSTPVPEASAAQTR